LGVVQWLGATFPYATLAVNLIGSFIISGVMYLGTDAPLLAPATRVVLVSGVLGGFTTYSSFNYETLRLLQTGAWGMAALNVVVTLLGCALAGFFGLLLATRVWG